MNLLCTLRFVELMAVYVMVKAIYEIYKTWKADKIDGSRLHTNQHIAALLVILFYSGYDVFSFLWFEHIMNDSTADYTISFFNMFFSNLMMLLMIDHFKQERVGEITKSTWWDLFKF